MSIEGIRNFQFLENLLERAFLKQPINKDDVDLAIYLLSVAIIQNEEEMKAYSSEQGSSHFDLTWRIHSCTADRERLALYKKEVLGCKTGYPESKTSKLIKRHFETVKQN